MILEFIWSPWEGGLFITSVILIILFYLKYLSYSLLLTFKKIYIIRIYVKMRNILFLRKVK